jgi:hypothetical protein
MAMWEPARAGGSTSPEHAHEIGNSSIVQDILGFEYKADANASQSSPGTMPWRWLISSELATIRHALSAGNCGNQVLIEYAAMIWQRHVLLTAWKQTALHAGLPRS